MRYRQGRQVSGQVTTRSTENESGLKAEDGTSQVPSSDNVQWRTI